MKTWQHDTHTLPTAIVENNSKLGDYRNRLKGEGGRKREGGRGRDREKERERERELTK